MEDSIICKNRDISLNSNYSIVFEDNGRVAYAYLLDNFDNIVGDVWLYNRCTTPLEPEWKNPDKMPFANSSEYVKNEHFDPVKNTEDVSVRWKYDDDKVQAKIYIHDRLFAILTEGSKPGKSLLANKNGPLAKVLE